MNRNEETKGNRNWKEAESGKKKKGSMSAGSLNVQRTGGDSTEDPDSIQSTCT